jgi:hypothetical protein
MESKTTGCGCFPFFWVANRVEHDNGIYSFKSFEAITRVRHLHTLPQAPSVRVSSPNASLLLCIHTLIERHTVVHVVERATPATLHARRLLVHHHHEHRRRRHHRRRA